ncbi:type II toxin-antitoxin system RelE/ParE family toxin [Beggiatoa leptomitoformis]|uniref:Uncharacterized protein n=1 Tax=Beggiatoa leptomitoformis TaxID=288004 RepID=A0A2N9YCQ9_9GAMM|nr:type II toxin-antitoxin system RelE/ParE family toxin [Beggiatoa leptomitoformis]ALG66459.1 hypothetical protein AL038_00285 [Beggiatoa leptomitoformis]AUI68259.1 hypothetical protein BLE401_05785 [Beggiatoa leptomitoformis]
MKLTAHYTSGFVSWWESLEAPEQVALHHAIINLLKPETLMSLHAHTQYAQMGELHVTHEHYTYNILYAFDLKQSTIVLVGGTKNLSCALQ